MSLMNEIEVTNNKAQRAIYIDNNLYHRLRTDAKFSDSFLLFFKNNYPEVFEDFEIYFSWYQVLEDLGLGEKGTKAIHTDNLWIESMKSFKKSSNRETLKVALNNCFDVAYEIVFALPDLQKDALLKKVEDSIKHGEETSQLFELTLGKIKKFIQSDYYIKELAEQLAWAFLTSYDFIAGQSGKQFKLQNLYFALLIEEWHDLFLKGRELDSYRLFEKRYFLSLRHEHGSKITYQDKIRINTNRDFCDSELIHGAVFGMKNDPYNERIPIIAFSTVTEKEKDKMIRVHEERLSIAKGTLRDLNHGVKGCKIQSTPGEIILVIVNVEDKENHKVVGAHRIPFNTPLKMRVN